MKKIIVKCKELKEEGIPPAALDKLERRNAYLIKHKIEDQRKKRIT